MPDNTAHGLWRAQAIHRFAHSPPLLIARQLLHSLAVAGFEQHKMSDQLQEATRLEQGPQQALLLTRRIA
ncbi:hypothetical protein D3C81_1497080 [compost metagenome]